MASQALTELGFDSKAKEKWRRLVPGSWWRHRSRPHIRVRIICVRGFRVRYECSKTRRNPHGENEIGARSFFATFAPESNLSAVPSPAAPRAKRHALSGFLICACRRNRIPAPEGATDHTRYTCRDCMALSARKASIEEAQRSRPWLAERIAEIDESGDLSGARVATG